MTFSHFKNHRFVYFHETPPMDDFSMEDLRKPEIKSEKPQQADRPEDIAKEREGLLARHEQISNRISKASAKLAKCATIIKSLPEGSDIRKKAEESYAEAEKILQRVANNFPKKESLKTDDTSETQKLKDNLQKANTTTAEVIKDLSSTEKEAQAAAESAIKLKELGINEETIRKIFTKSELEIKGYLVNLNLLNKSGTEENFKKLIEALNKNFELENITNGAVALNQAGCTIPQILTALTLPRILSGTMKVGELVNILQESAKLGLKAHETLILISELGDENLLPYLNLIKQNPELAKNLEKIPYYAKLQQGLRTQGFTAPIDPKTMDTFYSREKNPAIVLKFMEDFKDILLPIEDKAVVFQLTTPDKAKAFYLESENLAYKIGIGTMKAIFLAKATGLPTEKITALWDKISKPEIDGEENPLYNADLTANPKKFAILLALYPEPKAFESLVKAKNPKTLESTPEALNFILRLKNEGFSTDDIFSSWKKCKNPDLAPFIIQLQSRRSEENLKNSEVKDFLEDPALPFAIEVYKKLGSKKKNSELALLAGRNFYHSGLSNPREIPDGSELLTSINESSTLPEEIAGLEVFKGRNILAFAGNEQKTLNGKTQNIFHTEGFKQNLENSAGKNVEILHTRDNSPDKKELIELKEEILSRFINTPPPMTMYFTGHANKNGLTLSENNYDIVQDESGKEVIKYNPESYISMKELSAAAQKRLEKFGDQKDLLKKDIYIFGCCDSQRLLRDFYAKLQAENHPALPLSISNTDFGAEFIDISGFSRLTEDSVAREVLQLGEPSITYGKVRKNASEYRKNGVTLFNPNSSGSVQLVATIELPEAPKTVASNTATKPEREGS